MAIVSQRGLGVIVLTAQHEETEEKALVAALTVTSPSRCTSASSSPGPERYPSA